MSSTADATAALRGYRLQALYTLGRILNQHGDSLIFQPEGVEDLAVYSASNQLLEIVQVKQRTSNLVLSSFKPDKPNSFVYRVSSELDNAPGIKVTIIAFGSVGPELQQALEDDEGSQIKVATKIASYGYLSEAKAKIVLEKVTLTLADETLLMASVYKALEESLPGVDPDSAFELLRDWIYVCGENRTSITRTDVIDRINKVGQFIVARAAHKMEWFTSIIPLEDKLSDDPEFQLQLAREFYQGISARYEHILASLDVVRSERLAEIVEAFRENRLVIIHAASGQGKSTLAYRYLRDYVPSQWRFRIAALASREQALRVALAVSQHAIAIGIPLVLYIDVLPRNTEWSELVRELNTHPNIRVLVTIREEDWRRSTISGSELPFKAIDLEFDRSEAERLYESLISKATPENVLDFEEAWIKFGEAGPLMEFAYLIAQGTSLHERLKKQVNLLGNEVREGRLLPAELDVLRLVSVASAFGARLQLVPLVQHLQLSAPQYSLALFEEEYLLRVSEQGALLDGLHPIRSEILSDLLSDPAVSPWPQSSSACLPFIHEDDLETFLLHSFSRRYDQLEPLLTALASYEPKTWNAIIGCVRSYIWLGVAGYVTENNDLIRDAAEQVGQGWAYFLDFDLTDSSEDQIAKTWWRDVIPEEGKTVIEQLQGRQTKKKEIFTRVREWLVRRNIPPQIPDTPNDWNSAAEAVFWLNQLHVQWPLNEWLTHDALETAMTSLPLSIMANLILALTGSQQFESWLHDNRPKCIERFRKETLSARLEDDGSKVTTHFVFDLDQIEERSSNLTSKPVAVPPNRFHWEASKRLDLLRKIFPERKTFATQGYGHLLFEEFLEYDDSIKTGVARKNLPIRWLTSVNALFGGLGDQQFRPRSWQEYAMAVINIRQAVVSSLKQLENGLNSYFRRTAAQLLGREVNFESWDDCRNLLKKRPLLPLSAVDEWGFVSEAISLEHAQEELDQQLSFNRNSLALQKHQSYLKAFNEHVRTLSNFYSQSLHGMVLQPLLAKGGDRNRVLQAAKENGLKVEFLRLATLNLADTVKNLRKFQSTARPLLGPFYTQDRLNRLDQEENDTISRIWAMWYFFAHHPKRVVQNARTECLREQLGLMKKIRLRLRDALRRASSDEIKITIVSESVTWEDDPALWITVDAHQPWDIYESLGIIINAIRQAVLVGEKELRRYTLDFFWPYVVVVPLTRGKCITPVAWHISLPVILQTDISAGLKWWNFAQHQIPGDALEQLDLDIWDLPNLAPAKNLLQVTALLFSIAAHIRDFRRLGEIDDEAIGILQEYVDRVSQRISEALQLAIDTETELAESINALQESELMTRPALIDMAETLPKLHEAILPSTNFESREALTLEKLIEWADRLEQAPQLALICSLDWTSDVLDQQAG
jgi:hypothetical protein